MCGIAGVFRRTDKAIPKLDQLADNLLLGIEDRGPHATGIATLAGAEGYVQKAVMKAHEFVDVRGPLPPKAKSVLLHTRYATMGGHTARNAHPQRSGTVVAIHNGHINNADEIFKTLNLPRKAEVDSEVIPALVSFAGWRHAVEALSILTGGAATAIIDAKHPNEVLLVRLRCYPLVYCVTKDMVIWASTIRAIANAWQKTYHKAFKGSFTAMKEGEYVRLAGGKIHKGEVPEVEFYAQPTGGSYPIGWQDGDDEGTWDDEESEIEEHFNPETGKAYGKWM